MGILEVKELTAALIKYGVNMEHTSIMLIKASGGLQILLSV